MPLWRIHVIAPTCLLLRHKTESEVTCTWSGDDRKTTMFGSLVLAEVPASSKKDCISRFEKATYLRPEFNSLGDVVVTVLPGQERFFVCQSFEIVSPLKWDVSLSPSALQFSTGCSLMFPLMISLRSLLNLCPLGLSSRWKIQMSRLFLHPGFMSMDRTY